MVSAGTVTIATCFWSLLYQFLCFISDITLLDIVIPSLLPSSSSLIWTPLFHIGTNYTVHMTLSGSQWWHWKPRASAVSTSFRHDLLWWNSYNVLALFYTLDITNNLLNIPDFYWLSCPGRILSDTVQAMALMTWTILSRRNLGYQSC